MSSETDLDAENEADRRRKAMRTVGKPLVLLMRPSSSTPEHRLDLVSGIRGVQVPATAKVIEWPNGLNTVLPTLERDRVNHLTYDAKYVRHVASYPMPEKGSVNIDFIDHSPAESDRHRLVCEIRESIAEGRPVVVRNFQDTSTFTFTEKGLYEWYGISCDMPVNIHNSGRHMNHFTRPHVVGKMSDIISGIDDPDRCQFVPNIPLLHYGMPEKIRTLDDGLCVGWGPASHTMPSDKTIASVNDLAARSLALAHHAGTLTYPRIDPDGYATFGIVMSGVKLWTWYFPSSPKVAESVDNFLKVAEELCDPYQYDHPKMEAETVCLYPGDLIIQPPAQVHLVYTPVASFMVGGHFYCLDTCHLTEIGRRFDCAVKGPLTNTTHNYVSETMLRMLHGLNILDSSRLFGKHAIVSLCVMVLFPDEYERDEHANRDLAEWEETQEFARDILKAFGLTRAIKRNPRFRGCRYDDSGDLVRLVIREGDDEPDDRATRRGRPKGTKSAAKDVE